MQLTKLEIKNFRLITETELIVDKDTTLIVGRNNTAKTSCMDFLNMVLLSDSSLSYDDYPLHQRKLAFIYLMQFIKGKYSYEKFIQKLPIPSVTFYIDYSLESDDDLLGNLSPFIIDVEENVTTATIKAEYAVKLSEEDLKELIMSCYYQDEQGELKLDTNDLRDSISKNFSKIFALNIVAINPKNIQDRQQKQIKELRDFLPLFVINAERNLDETGNRENSSLKPLISAFFNKDIKDIAPEIVTEVEKLRVNVANANKDLQRVSNQLLSSIIDSSVGFGYPNTEELQLGINTKIQIDNQIQEKAELTYRKKNSFDELPSSYNGLGYKNLIKIEFLLAQFAESIKSTSLACIPLLFIEEPESHMHPQLQQTFSSYLEEFIKKISNVPIQTFLTSHSSHIANTMDFSKIRYAQKTIKGVIYKSLDNFSEENPDNIDFIRKYLMISRCDLFFADKTIFVEGASERLLIPDMIEKCNTEGLFNTVKYKLPSQYYSTIEIGGAYAYKFIPFIEFLGIPCLILTDVDAMIDGRTKSTVSNGKTTSNSTIKWWIRSIKGLDKKAKIDLEKDIMNLSKENKTISKCHIEYQTTENTLCGRSLEESIKNVNRDFYELKAPVTEDDIDFNSKSKTDFALNLMFENPNYIIPSYIKNGLVWLNEQSVLI